VSPRTVHFRVLDKRPVSGPGKGPPSFNNNNHQKNRLTDTQSKLAVTSGEGQGGLACCSPWGRRVRDDLVTEQQHSTILRKFQVYNTVLHDFKYYIPFIVI